jgi:hypothetical protein
MYRVSFESTQQRQTIPTDIDKEDKYDGGFG